MEPPVAAITTFVAPVAAAPVAGPIMTRDSFNAQSLGRGLNARVKQVGTRRSIASFIPPATTHPPLLLNAANEILLFSLKQFSPPTFSPDSFHHIIVA